MTTVLRWAGTAVLFAAAFLLFSPTLVMPFLDRIYHVGPPSDHFDGERFFNLGGDVPRAAGRRNFLGRWTRGERAEWPDHVSVRTSVPPARVDGGAMRVTWVGHATVLVQAAGLNILTDPIWSDRASPFPFIGPRRVRSPGIDFDDLPKIDLVLVSHNHYDHMDLPTLRRLWDRDRPLIVSSLGNDTILAHSGIGARTADWGEEVAVRPGISVRIERNHHWSTRWTTDRNRALWSAFTIRLPGGNVFYAGDTGWGDGSWVGEAARSGPFRLAIVPIGAFEPRDFMRNSHIDPAEALAVFEALAPRRGLGVHWGTFQLSFEPIDAPRRRLAELASRRGHDPGRFITVEAGDSFLVP